METIEKFKKPNSIIIKYVGPVFKGKVRFGRFKDYPEWVHYMHQQKKGGNPIQMCMSYYDYSQKSPNPCFKEVNTDPNFGSQFIDWNEEDD